MSKKSNFRSLLTSLWFRLCTLGIVALVFAEALLLAPGKAQGWTFYLTASEVAFEVVVRLVFAALAGMALGTVCTAAIAPISLASKIGACTRSRLGDEGRRDTSRLPGFRLALQILIKWSYGLSWPTRALRQGPAYRPFYLAFALPSLFPALETRLLPALTDFWAKNDPTNSAGDGGGAAALVVTEFVLSKSMPAVRAALRHRGPSRTSF